jgi:DNA-binding beta-propeller fold protein YncE
MTNSPSNRWRTHLNEGAIMKIAAWATICLAYLALGPCLASADGTPEFSPPSEATATSSPLNGSLVVAGSPLESELVQAEYEAKLANPETIAVREASRTKYENLDTEQAAKVDGEAFPAVIGEPAGGPPKLPVGESITSYVGDNAALLDLGEGKHGVLESLAPIAVQTGPGQRVPVDLGLRDAGGAFEPATPVVGVRIPRRLGEGVSLGSSGVSLTPVDGSGSSLGGSEGAVDGASVFFAGTQTDMDTVVKPTTLGFETDTMLRSVESQQELYFKVGVPDGARLVQASEGSGNVEVIDKGAAIATVITPSAHDAAGSVVPVSMTASGDVLTLTVDHRAGKYQYPIEVDPYVKDDEQVAGKGQPTNWKFCVNYSTACAHEEGPFRSTGWGGEALVDQARSKYVANETSAFVYQTQGESRIFQFSAYLSGENAGANIESVIQIAGMKEKEGKQEVTVEATTPKPVSVSTNYGPSWYTACVNEGCTSAGGLPHNTARFQQTATGSGERFSDTMSKVNVEIAQEKGPGQPTFNYSSETVGGRTNVLHGTGSWLSPSQGAFEVHESDPGIGISWFGVGPVVHEFYNEGKCSGVQCFPELNEVFTYSSKLVDGEQNMEAVGKDLAAGYGLVGQAKIKVDGTPPHGILLEGVPSNGVINEAQYHLQLQATDGSGTTPSSGIKSIEIGELGSDGRVYQVGTGKSGGCSLGPCTAVGEWTLSGEALGAGKHTLEVLATDNAGNIGKKEFTITVRHVGSLGVGPGSVDPITGAFHLSASDVSIGSGGGSLGVSRSYDSRQLTAGEQGSLGPQWSLNVSGSRALEQEPSGSVVLVAPDGGLTTFESNGKGGFVSPKGDENLVLEGEKEGEKVKAYLLKDPASGTIVRYTQPGGAGPWVVASSEGALSSKTGEKETFEWERLEGLTRPKEAFAPAPAGVSCSSKVERGCRALKFVYATATTATGEAPSQWGEYNGRLKKIVFATNTLGEVQEKTVAEYAYDKQGRLRAEWDPRIEPVPLKTTYGYDSEGHVTSVNSPGQQPSLLHYGTTLTDPSAGRLLSVTRPPASTPTELKEADERSAPANTTLPTLSSTSPAIGTTLSVSSNGSWSNSPLAYSYAWEDCSIYESKETCTAILGAVNATYTPQARDAGYKLRAQVTAVNADGATVATTNASSAVAAVAPEYHLQFGKVGEAEGQFKGSSGDAIDSSGNVWVVDSSNSRIQEFSASGTFIKAIGWGVSNGKAEFEICTSSCKAGISGFGAGQFWSPQGIAISQANNDVYVVDRGNNRVEEFKSSGEYIGTFGKKGKGLGELEAPTGIAVAPNGDVWVGDYGNNRVTEFSETGEALGSFGSEGAGSGQFKGPEGIAFAGSNAYVVDSGNNRVQEFSLSGAYIAKFGSKGTGNGQYEAPTGIATEPVSGDLYVADYGNNRVEEINPAGVFLLSYGKKGAGNGEFSSPEQIAANAVGDLYVSDSANNRVQELEPKYSNNNPVPEPPALGANAVATIDYNVPLWGEGAPDTTAKNEAEMKAEREKWGQTDDPAQPTPGESLATAVFPPDEPMGWPAKDYKRASISYYDELGHKVNAATPSGGIATSEYNEYNEVIRSLSADNRAAALKEANPKATSELLDTKSKYNGETAAEREKEEKELKEKSEKELIEALEKKEEERIKEISERHLQIEPGTRLLETRGPQHTVKLATGGEKLARNHVKYSYDEGAPGGERFNLVTKSTDGAEYEGKEADIRTSVTSYSGQEDLGWLLRKPTSVTTDPEGLDLVRTTLYEESTGNVIETRQPGAESAMNFSAKFGSEGTGNGQLKEPKGIAVAPNGGVYVVDAANERVQELSATGEYITKWGSEGTGNGQFKKPRGITIAANGNVYVADAGNDRIQEFSSTGEYITKWGVEGTGNGQFKEPQGVAVAASGNVYVADTLNNRVQEFSATGEYITKWGSEGKGNGQFEWPVAIALAAGGNVYVKGSREARIQEFASAGEYITQWSVAGSAEAVALAPNGNVYLTNNGIKQLVEEFSSSGALIARYGPLGSGNGQFRSPKGIVVAPNGAVYVADTGNNRVQTLVAASEIPSYDLQFGSEGTESGQFKSPQSTAVAANGNVYVADTGNGRIEELSATGAYITKWSVTSPQSVAVATNGNVYVITSNYVFEYTSSGTLVTFWGSEGTTNGHFKSPEGIAVGASGNVYVADTGNNRVQEFSSSGTYIAQWGKEGTGNGEFKSPEGIVATQNGGIYVTDTHNNRVQEFSPSGTFLTKWGSVGKGKGLFTEPVAITIARNGSVYVGETGYGTVQEFTATGEYIATTGSSGSGNGQFNGPKGMSVAANGNLYVADTGNNRVQEFLPVNAHDTQTIYYTAAANSAHPSCGGRPEWAHLPCQTQRSAQPLGSLPALPVVTESSYNMWDEPLTVTETFGSTKRTKKMTYDTAGRPLTSEATSTIDTTLPKVTNEYSSETGAMVKQSTTVGETTKTIKSVYNTQGQLTEYTDADGNTTQYVYSGPANDGQVEEIKYGGEKGSQIYSYDPTTKALTKLLDVGPEGGVGAGTFTAGYDVEGKLTSETYPNGMTAKYTYNPVSEATGIEYEKTAHCAGTCPEVWFKETIVPTIHGEALSRTSTLAKENYAYDNAGRLLTVEETPAGGKCVVRSYGYDEDSNRLGLVSREPVKEGGGCPLSGGTLEGHTYDEGNRLADTGIEYETFGNQTKIPASDAGEHEITASFYVDNQVAVQKQNGETTSYSYDPAGRTEKTVSEGGTKATVINHYPGSGGAISWSEEEEGKKWTRNIPGIDGALAATQHNSEAAVLQLHDLQGNIIATAAVNEIETKLLTSYNPTEYGVPVNGTPPTKFSWLGASGYTPEQSSGAANPGGGSYVPQLGRELQTEPIIPPGAFPNGSYSGAPYTTSLEPWVNQSIGSWGAGGTGREAARQAEAKKHQEEAEAAWRADHYVPENTPSPGEGGVEEEGEGVSGGEEELIIVGEGSAHSASAGLIVCTSKVQDPHKSTHAGLKGRNEVNIVATLSCTSSEVGLFIRVALFYEGWNVGQGETTDYGTSSIKANVNVTCKTGWYQGWAEFQGEGELNIERKLKWGKKRYVQC